MGEPVAVTLVDVVLLSPVHDNVEKNERRGLPVVNNEVRMQQSSGSSMSRSPCGGVCTAQSISVWLVLQSSESFPL